MINKRKNYFSSYCKLHGEKRNKRSKQWRLDHPEQQKENIKRRTGEIKLIVLTHYSNGQPICACCGEKNIKFLTIDHINNDGAEHRKKIKNYNICYWLKKNDYPEGFGVRCYNCNCGKWHNNGICPHKEQISQ
jgi:hypothetical protein